MKAMTILRIQQELSPWQEHNFGARPPWYPLAGMFEEVGELSEAYLQDVSPSNEVMFDKYLEDLRDAVGDITVYLLDFCNAMNIDLAVGWKDHEGVMIEPSSGWVSLLRITKNVGKVSHAHLKMNQGIRVTEDHAGNHKKYCVMVLESLQEFCINTGLDFDKIVNETWDSVKFRDWKKFPKNGKTE